MNKFLSLYILYPFDVTYIMTRLGTKLTPEEEKLRRKLDDARRAKAFEKSNFLLVLNLLYYHLL